MPIVFLHGNGFCKEVFEGIFDCPMLAEHRLISIDLPGHGASWHSSEPSRDYSFQGMAEAVAATLSFLGIRNCILAGWSLGGHVALEMTEAAGVDGVLAFGAPPTTNGPLGLIKAFHLNRMFLLAGKARFSTTEAEWFERMALGESADGRFISSIITTDPALRPALSRSILAPGGSNQRKALETSEIPIALLNGSDDVLVRRTYLEGIRANSLWRGKALEIEDCGHAPFVEQPGIFTTILKVFCQDVVKTKNRSQRNFLATRTLERLAS